MKKNIFLALVAIVLLVFSSCSNEETLTTENLDANLKKTFKIKRDATGAYSLDFGNRTKIDQILESTDNTRQFLLSSSSDKTEKNNSQELLINNDKLKIGFIDVDTDKEQHISIIDNDIASQKNSNNNKLAD
jgi:hypothetical protein